MDGDQQGRAETPSSPSRCWLLGNGISILAAALYLIHAGIPGPQVHILLPASDSLNKDSSHGNDKDGFTVSAGLELAFFEPRMNDLLGLIPPSENDGKPLSDVLKVHGRDRGSREGARTRLLQRTNSGPVRVNTSRLHMRPKDRIGLARFMLQSEASLGNQSVRQCFDPEFFDSAFWLVWSTTFALRSLHSAVEFQRHIAKYFQRIQHFDDTWVLSNLPYTFHESVLVPIMEHLQRTGVVFTDYTDVNITCSDIVGESSRITKVSTVTTTSATGNISTIVMGPRDIVIVRLGPTTSHKVLGSHFRPPPRPRHMLDREVRKEWHIWHQLAQGNQQLGNPSNFDWRLSETTLVTFTITLRDSLFTRLYIELTENSPGEAAFMTVAYSSWQLTLNFPQQPIFADQPDGVQIVWGYGLAPEQDGDYVAKPMYACSGEEILIELLTHLNFPTEQILSSTTVIPCLLPFATSPLVTRQHQDRPQVTPEHTRNLAVVGLFVEIPHGTSFSMDYEVRGAQIAVQKLLGLGAQTSEAFSSRLKLAAAIVT